MCGPLVFYNDYVAFIDGSCYSTQKQGDTTEDIPSPLVGILNVGIHFTQNAYTFRGSNYASHIFLRCTHTHYIHITRTH